jgi:hypothetical protein
VLIEELAAIVGVPFAQRDGQPLPDVMDRAAHARLAEAPDDLQLGRRGRDIDGEQRGQIEARRRLATVQDEIALQGAGADVGPLTPGAQGDLLPERRRGRADAIGLAAPLPPQRAKQPIQRGGAGGEQRRAGGGCQDEPVVTLQGLQQRREHGGEEATAKMIAGHPRPLERGQQGRP